MPARAAAVAGDLRQTITPSQQPPQGGFFVGEIMTVITAEKAGGANVCAFLDMLGWSEGTVQVPGSDDGYNVLVGGTLFTGYADHPRVSVALPRYGIRSTAAGRYQFLSRTWDAIVRNYGFRGRFIPEAQDLAAIKLLKECGAYPLIQQGNITEAIKLAAPIWASLPGAGYGQREHRLTKLLEIYADERAAEAQPEEQLLAVYAGCGGEVAC
jgi:muramidase (phage lysozyme)